LALLEIVKFATKAINYHQRKLTPQKL